MNASVIKSDTSSIDSFKPKKSLIKQTNGPIKVNKEEIDSKSIKKITSPKRDVFKAPQKPIPSQKQANKNVKKQEDDKENKDTIIDSNDSVAINNQEELQTDVKNEVTAEGTDSDNASKEAIKAISTEEEIYKKKLEEKRREAREKAAKEAELERIRQEELQKQEEERLLLEEELQRKSEEEEIKFQLIAAEQEKERLRLAIEEQERLEAERKAKEESERKAVNNFLIFL